jgi:hypothetical protein
MPFEYWSAKDGALVWKNQSGSKPTLSSARAKPTPSANCAPCTSTSGFADFTRLAIGSKLAFSLAYVVL